MLPRVSASIVLGLGALGLLVALSTGVQSCASKDVQKHEQSAAELKGKSDELAKAERQAKDDAQKAKELASKHEARANGLESEVAELKRRLANARGGTSSSGTPNGPHDPDLGASNGGGSQPDAGGMALADTGKLLEVIRLQDETIKKQDEVIAEKNKAIEEYKVTVVHLEGAVAKAEAAWKAERERSEELQSALRSQKVATAAASWNGGWKGALLGAAVGYLAKR